MDRWIGAQQSLRVPHLTGLHAFTSKALLARRWGSSKTGHSHLLPSGSWCLQTVSPGGGDMGAQSQLHHPCHITLPSFPPGRAGPGAISGVKMQKGN